MGAAGAALTLASPAGALSTRRRNALVIYDSRFAEARHFARIAADDHKLLTLSFAGDATGLWYDQLTGALDNGTFVIGLTAGGARFCVQLMAAPGARVTHHVTHTNLASAAAHACWTGDHLAEQELRCASAWPEQAARIALRHSIAVPAGGGRQPTSRDYPAHLLQAEDHLESWVLAPAPAAMRGARGIFEERTS